MAFNDGGIFSYFRNGRLLIVRIIYCMGNSGTRVFRHPLVAFGMSFPALISYIEGLRMPFVWASLSAPVGVRRAAYIYKGAKQHGKYERSLGDIWSIYILAVFYIDFSRYGLSSLLLIQSESGNIHHVLVDSARHMPSSPFSNFYRTSNFPRQFRISI